MSIYKYTCLFKYSHNNANIFCDIIQKASSSFSFTIFNVPGLGNRGSDFNIKPNFLSIWLLINKINNIKFCINFNSWTKCVKFTQLLHESDVNYRIYSKQNALYRCTKTFIHLPAKIHLYSLQFVLKESCQKYLCTSFWFNTLFLFSF